jgi:NADH-quinone oxidoreductase subunit L
VWPTWAFTTVALGIVAVGIGVAILLYGLRTVPETAPADVSVLTVAARRDLYGDVFNEDVFMRPSAQLTHTLVDFDNKGVDGSVNALANLVNRTSERLRGFQTGFARNYALEMLAGAALVAVAILAVQLWT